MNNNSLDKLFDIGKILGFSKQETKVFAYKALGYKTSDIAVEIGISDTNCSDCVVRVCKKLNIHDDNSHR